MPTHLFDPPEASAAASSPDHLWLTRTLDAMGAAHRVTLYFDEAGICHYASATLSALFGHAQSAALGRSFETIHFGEQALFELRSDQRRGEFSRWMKAPTQLMDASERVRIELTPLELGSGRGVLGHYQRMSPHLGQSAWERAMQALPLGIALLDKCGAVRFVNDEVYRVTEQPRPWRHLEERARYTLKTPRGERLEGRDHPLRRALVTGKDVSNETLLLHFEPDDEVRRVECSARHLGASGEAKGALIWVLRDVSERHQRALQKEDVLSIASHELRNPLTPLRGLLQMIDQDHRRHGRIEPDHLHKAQDQVERMVKLVDGLLDLSIVETGRFSYSKTRHDLRELVDELIAERCVRDGDERFALELPGEPLPAWVDAAGIEQVLHNVVDNALKHSPEGTIVRVVLSADHALGVANLMVRDAGPGFDSEAHPLLFDRFTQGPSALKPGHGSLGLGLYICRRIIEEHEGSIELHSAPGQGTTVAVRLPIR